MNDLNERKIIEKLQAAKSQAEVDPMFAHTLRAVLGTRMEKQLRPSFMNRFNFAIAGVVVVAVVALMVFQGNDKVLLPGTQEIYSTQEAAFGKLDTVATTSRGQGGGGGPESMTGGFGGGGGSSMPATDLKIAPDFAPVNYKFVYKGEEFTIEEDKMEVYKRQKGFGANVNFSSFIKQFSVEMFNPAKFGQANLQYFRVEENKDFGYGLNIDLKEGAINISEVWERWQTPDRQCKDQACYESMRLKPDQIPADDVVVNATNQFLDEYGISRANYGEPLVQNYWRAEYERVADKSQYYIPDVVTVIYPIKIAGQEVQDEGGNKTGMVVAYNVRVGKVSSVYELNSQRYQSSLYTVEKDSKRIIEIAERGGFRAGFPTIQEGAKAQTIELGTPVRGLVKVWNYTGGMTSEELYVPALIFPITAMPDGFYMRSVVVPLVQDVLNIPTPTPMPIDIMR